MEYEVKGRIKEICNFKNGTSQSTGKQWQMIEMILVENEGTRQDGTKWESLLRFEAFGDIVNVINDEKKIGATVSVKFAIRTDEYNGKLYTKLRPMSVEVISDESSEASEKSKEEEMYSKAAHDFTESSKNKEEPFVTKEQSDELPF